MSVSNNGMLVYHPNGSVIHAYNIQSGELVGILQGHFDKVELDDFHPQKR